MYNRSIQRQYKCLQITRQNNRILRGNSQVCSSQCRTIRFVVSQCRTQGSDRQLISLQITVQNNISLQRQCPSFVNHNVEQQGSDKQLISLQLTVQNNRNLQRQYTSLQITIQIIRILRGNCNPKDIILIVNSIQLLGSMKSSFQEGQ